MTEQVEKQYKPRKCEFRWNGLCSDVPDDTAFPDCSEKWCREHEGYFIPFHAPSMPLINWEGNGKE